MQGCEAPECTNQQRAGREKRSQHPSALIGDARVARNAVQKGIDRITSREIVPTVRISPRFLRASEVPIMVPHCFRQLFGQQERITLRRWTGTISREADLFGDGGLLAVEKCSLWPLLKEHA